MLSFLKTKFALFKNRLRRRKGLSLQDQCAKVIMHPCSLQLERAESRELASTKGATGLIAHLSTYFPLLPKPHNGPTYAPELGGAA
mgnify:CR=1 FL=1